MRIEVPYFFGERCGSWYGKWGFPEDTKYSNNHDYISFNSIGSFTVLGVDQTCHFSSKVYKIGWIQNHTMLLNQQCRTES